MAELKPNSAVASDLTGVKTDFSVTPEITDSTQDQKESEWINSDWSQQFGYFNQIPELQAAINAKATWTIGKGVEADPQTTFILDSIRGWGKDTFNTILRI